MAASSPIPTVRSIEDFGTAFGEDRAAELTAGLQEDITDIVTAVDDPAAITIALAQPETDAFRLILGGYLGAELLDEIGFARPPGQGDEALAESENGNDIRAISLEEIDRIGPADFVFITTGFLDGPNPITDSPLWDEIEAARRGDFAEVPFEYWNVGGPLAAELVLDDIERELRDAGLVGE